MSLPPAQVLALIVAENPIVYNSLAASMFLIWDHCITFGQEEVDFVWRSKWSVVNSLFFFIRYLSLAIRVVELVIYTNVSGLIHPSTTNCVAWVWFRAVGGQALIFSVDLLLILRVFAFYGRNKRLLVGLLALFLGNVSAHIVLVALTVPKMLIIPSPLPTSIHAGACLIVNIPPLFSTYWVPALIFESILFMLVAAKFIHTRYRAGSDSPPILVVFIRDGTWAFATIFAGLLWAALAFGLTPEQGDIALTWLFSILGFCGTRLILNLRTAALRPSVSTIGAQFELKYVRNKSTGRGFVVDETDTEYTQMETHPRIHI